MSAPSILSRLAENPARRTLELSDEARWLRLAPGSVAGRIRGAVGRGTIRKAGPGHSETVPAWKWGELLHFGACVGVSSACRGKNVEKAPVGRELTSALSDAASSAQTVVFVAFMVAFAIEAPGRTRG